MVKAHEVPRRFLGDRCQIILSLLMMTVKAMEVRSLTFHKRTWNCFLDRRPARILDTQTNTFQSFLSAAVNMSLQVGCEHGIQMIQCVRMILRITSRKHFQRALKEVNSDGVLQVLANPQRKGGSEAGKVFAKQSSQRASLTTSLAGHTMRATMMNQRLHNLHHVATSDLYH
eukprot:gnl/MRDRNA2_/MRDRNA2_245617_c0_seq1.p1 gnl/MRDRNA2_/MRDRNA2_245617_c0~~gnl/MRDRNA2_/MRDRNA2_245617_c0_seq1.p1  ORF type:complete len:172 (+),score=16.65 gnl/MRDRNA2_/MRDRNA2_245617_c0_seq1:110-625(+)